MSDSALSVKYQKFRYKAHSDIADHGYRTKCPPIDIWQVNVFPMSALYIVREVWCALVHRICSGDFSKGGVILGTGRDFWMTLLARLSSDKVCILAIAVLYSHRLNYSKI